MTTKSFTFNIMNTGFHKAAEIAQLYLTVPETDNYTGKYRSPQDLKGFVKTKPLMPGRSQNVTITLTDRHFSYWDVNSHKFVVEKGNYTVQISASSRDHRLNTVVTI